MTKDNLGNRMKDNYENRSKTYLVRRMPAIIRIDGKAFHTFTRGLKKPFDDILIKVMQETTKYLCENIQGCKLGYTQSDEITLLLTDFEKLNTDAWFDYNIQKMCSISASMATLAFNKAFEENVHNFAVNKVYNINNKDTRDISEISNEYDLNKKYLDVLKRKLSLGALFDARVFNIPKEEVCNCFIWRQQDATRNAIEMVGHANFSTKELHKVNCNQIQEKLWQEKGINFNDFETYKKRGSCVIKTISQIGETERSKWVVDLEIPIFSRDRDYIDKYL